MKALLGLIIFFSTYAEAKTCYYKIKEDSAKVTFTGFKYTEKTGVAGTFTEVSYKQKEAKSIRSLLKSISFDIKSKSLSTGNPARDATLRASVLGFLQQPEKITGKVVSATDKTMKIEMILNEKTPVDFDYAAKDGKLTARGTLNLLENGLSKSLAALAKACQGLHTGKDGVTKTWPDVELIIEADYEEKCSNGLMDSIKSWFS